MTKLYDKKYEMGEKMLEGSGWMGLDVVRYFTPPTGMASASDIARAPKYSRDVKPSWINQGLYRKDFIRAMLAVLFISIAFWLYFSVVSNAIGPAPII
jgi:hypothetical protein